MVQYHHLKCRKPATYNGGKPTSGYGFKPATDYGPNPPPKMGDAARLVRAPGIAKQFGVAAGMPSARRLILGKIAQGYSRPISAMPSQDVKCDARGHSIEKNGLEHGS